MCSARRETDGRDPAGARRGGEAADFIDTHLAKAGGSQLLDPSAALITTRSEALGLYRAVLRASLLFVWRDENGAVWRDRIRESARAEFEVNRLVRDPETVARLLLQGRDALDQSLERFLAKRDQIIREEEDAARRGGGPPQSGAGTPPTLYGNRPPKRR